MRLLRFAFACAFVATSVSCEEAPRCGTGALDEASGTCTCPLASDASATCRIPRDRFDVEGHRGAHTAFPPGNTLPAFIEAIRVGADTLEGDMQVTSDRFVVLNHDATLSPECVYIGPGTVPPSRVIAELLMSEIALFDCHSGLVGIDPPPTLESVLDLRTRANVGFDLELKVARPAEVDTAMQALTDYDASCGHCLEGRLIIQSFDAAALMQARASFGGDLAFETSLLSAIGVDEPATVASFADIYAPIFGVVTSDLVKAFHAQGVRVLPWTVNDEPTMCEFIAFGVDGLISDDPALLAHAKATCR